MGWDYSVIVRIVYAYGRAHRLRDEEARFLAAIEKGIAAAERGEFIEEEEMDVRVERMFKP